ncbi:MAG: hypothetical protein IKB78_04805, partial [Clostridia bacterium]|nr:hypothetical protein [Clostridia bacterium]
MRKAMRNAGVLAMILLVLFASTALAAGKPTNPYFHLAKPERPTRSRSAGSLQATISCLQEPVLLEEALWQVTAEGGEAPYTYSYYIMAEDWSVTHAFAAPAQDADTYTYTFVAPGTYILYVIVEDANGLEFWETLDVEVADPGNAMTVEAKVKQVAEKCIQAGCATDYEKALWLHDWLVNNAYYDQNYAYYSAEGVLLRGTGVCDSYSRAYEMLLEQVGIASKRVAGGNHAWNLVQMDEGWYHIDPTWDDPITGNLSVDNKPVSGYELRHYFGLPDRIMSEDHTYVVETKANAYRHNYFIHEGLLEKADLMEDYKAQISEKLEAGELDFTIEARRSYSYTQNGYYFTLDRHITSGLAAYLLRQHDWQVEGESKTLLVDYDNTNFILQVDRSNDAEALALDTVTEVASEKEQTIWYKLVAEKGGYLTLNAQDATGVFSVMLQDSQGSTVAWSNGQKVLSAQGGTEEAPANISGACMLAAGEYILKVRSAAGQYTLEPVYEIWDSGEEEPNNTIDQAAQLPVNEEFRGMFASENDTDWYRFTLKESCRVDWLFRNHGDQFYIKIYYENNGTTTTVPLLVGNKTSSSWQMAAAGGGYLTPVEATAHQFLPAGDYLIQMVPGDQGVYSLEVQADWIGAVEKEPNNGEEAASLLPLNKKVGGVIDALSDYYDFYTFTLEEPGVMDVTLRDTTGYMYAMLYRKNADDTASYLKWEGEDGNAVNYLQLNGGTAEKPAAASKQFYLAQGTYYARMRTNCGIYDIETGFEAVASGEKEPDSAAAPTALTMGEWTNGMLESCTVDFDYFSFEVEEASRVKLSVESSVGKTVYASLQNKDTGAAVSILRENGTEGSLMVESGTLEEAKTAQGEVLLDAGTYLLTVYGGEGVYRLQAEATPLGLLEKEPNDTRERAAAMPLDQDHLGLFSGSGDVDWYSFTLEEAGQLNLTLESRGSEVLAYICAEDEPLVLISAEDGQRYTVACAPKGSEKAPVTGVYSTWLRAGTYDLSASATGKGLYGVRADFTPAEILEKEPNNTAQTATLLPLNEDVCGLSDMAAAEDEKDVYRLAVTEPGTLKLTAKDTIGMMQVTLARENADGTTAVCRWMDDETGLDAGAAGGAVGGTAQEPADIQGLFYVEAGEYLLTCVNDYGTYQLRADFSPVELQGVLTPENPVRGMIDSAQEDEADAYSFTLREAGLVRFSLESETRNAVKLHLLDGENRELSLYCTESLHITAPLSDTTLWAAANGDEPGLAEGTACLAAGTYTVTLEGGAGLYTLAMDVETVRVQETEPNNTMDAAQPLAADSKWFTAMLESGETYRVGDPLNFGLSYWDWYSFSVEKGMIVRVDISQMNPHLEVALVNAAGMVVQVWNHGMAEAEDAESNDWSLPAIDMEGDYYLAVRGNEGLYSLRCVNENALTLDAIVPVRAEVRLGDAVTVNVLTKGEGTVEGMQFLVYDQNGQQVGGWEGISDDYTFTPGATGQYVIRVHMKAADDEWHYADSPAVTVKPLKDPLKLNEFYTDVAELKVGEQINFILRYEGNDFDNVARMLFYTYDGNGQQLGDPWVYDGFIGHYGFISNVPGRYAIRVFALMKDGSEMQVVTSPFFQVIGEEAEKDYIVLT